MEISYAITTNNGNRDYNEDYALIKEENGKYCFVVADGLGGHGKGEVASQLVCQVCTEIMKEEESLEQIFQIAQERLLQKQKEEHCEDGMKTTMNIVLADDKSIKWGHVGDTRTYYFCKGRMVSRTKDHSVPQMMVAMKEIKEKEIRHHPDRNRLLKVMGIEWNRPQYTIEEVIKTGKKQAFLLCTDGFWEFIEDADMVKCLKKASSPEEWLEKMNLIVKENGKTANMDNFTALAVWMNY